VSEESSRLLECGNLGVGWEVSKVFFKGICNWSVRSMREQFLNADETNDDADEEGFSEFLPAEYL
jgi:hypothetical protein